VTALSALLYLPSAHLEQLAEPSLEKVPAKQIPHVVPPDLPLKVPAAQGVHEAAAAAE
jgi:hypothetical protein